MRACCLPWLTNGILCALYFRSRHSSVLLITCFAESNRSPSVECSNQPSSLRKDPRTYQLLLLTLFHTVSIPLLKNACYSSRGNIVVLVVKTSPLLLLIKNYKILISEICSFFLATQPHASSPFKALCLPSSPGSETLVLYRLCFLHKTPSFGHVSIGYTKSIIC